MLDRNIWKQARQGSILVMTLVVMSLLLMVAGAFLLSNRQAGVLKSEDFRATQARTLARSAINRLAENLQFDPNYSSDLNWSNPSGNRSYEITFNPSQTHPSTNNLSSDSTRPSTWSGDSVPARSAEILVTTQIGTRTDRFRFVMDRGLAVFGVVGANGAIYFGDDVEMESITSLQDDDPVLFSIISNDQTNGISYANNGTFQLTPEARMRSAGPISPTIQAAFASPDHWTENASKKILPEIPVDSHVAAHRTDPAPHINAQGTAVIRRDSYHSGNMTINGQVNLGDAALYVEGDLTINGGVSGHGSIFATGNVTIAGGNASIHTNAKSGAAIYAGGDLDFTGLAAEGLMDALAAADPGGSLDLAWAKFKAQYRLADEIISQSPSSYVRPPQFTAVLGTPWSTFTDPNDNVGSLFTQYPQARDFFWAHQLLGQGLNGSEVGLPKPGPDSRQSRVLADSTTREVWEALTSLPGFGTDARLGHLRTAFEDLSFTFRHDWRDVTGIRAWDTTLGPYLEGEVSFDHATWLLFGRSDPSLVWINGDLTVNYTGPLYNNPDLFAQYVKELFDHNSSLDFGWLGKSYFQGILYSRGDLTIQNGATVVGGIQATGDIYLRDGADFTYNKEYEELARNQGGPFRVVSFSKL